MDPASADALTEIRRIEFEETAGVTLSVLSARQVDLDRAQLQHGRVAGADERLGDYRHSLVLERFRAIVGQWLRGVR